MRAFLSFVACRFFAYNYEKLWAGLEIGHNWWSLPPVNISMLGDYTLHSSHWIILLFKPICWTGEFEHCKSEWHWTMCGLYNNWHVKLLNYNFCLWGKWNSKGVKWIRNILVVCKCGFWDSVVSIKGVLKQLEYLEGCYGCNNRSG